MGIDVTLAGMVLLQMILSPEKPSISATTAGISIAAGYFSFQWLFEVGIRQGQVLKSYARYYHEARTHLSFDKQSPLPRSIESPEQGNVVAIPHVGGLHHEYRRAA